MANKQLQIRLFRLPIQYIQTFDYNSNNKDKTQKNATKMYIVQRSTRKIMTLGIAVGNYTTFIIRNAK